MLWLLISSLPMARTDNLGCVSSVSQLSTDFPCHESALLAHSKRSGRRYSERPDLPHQPFPSARFSASFPSIEYPSVPSRFSCLTTSQGSPPVRYAHPFFGVGLDRLSISNGLISGSSSPSPPGCYLDAQSTLCRRRDLFGGNS